MYTCAHTHTHSTIQCPWRYRFWGSECTQEEDIVANPFGSSAVHMTKVWISHPGSWWAGLSSLIRDQANENTAVLYLPSLGHVAPEAAMMGEGEVQGLSASWECPHPSCSPFIIRTRSIASEAEEWQGSSGWWLSDNCSTPRLKPWDAVVCLPPSPSKVPKFLPKGAKD